MTDLKEFQRYEQRPFVKERNMSCFCEQVSFSDEGPLLVTLQFFEVSHSIYQPYNFLPYCVVLMGPNADKHFRTEVKILKKISFILYK